MREIIGNTTTTPMPQSDWEQHDKNKADYIKNKPDLLTLGETENTAYRGDYGKIAYEHSQAGGGMHMPTIGEGDNGKFLRAINGVATWATVPNAEDNTF